MIQNNESEVHVARTNTNYVRTDVTTENLIPLGLRIIYAAFKKPGEGLV